MPSAYAVSVCYLWLNDLCLVRGNKEDLAKEVSRAGSIYAVSFFTIAAADVRDYEAGLFRSHQPF